MVLVPTANLAVENEAAGWYRLEAIYSYFLAGLAIECVCVRFACHNMATDGEYQLTGILPILGLLHQHEPCAFIANCRHNNAMK